MTARIKWTVWFQLGRMNPYLLHSFFGGWDLPLWFAAFVIFAVQHYTCEFGSMVTWFPCQTNHLLRFSSDFFSGSQTLLHSCTASPSSGFTHIQASSHIISVYFCTLEIQTCTDKPHHTQWLHPISTRLHTIWIQTVNPSFPVYWSASE